ncbi:substrate-binding periplasmic protein [Permianibacter aggregans]|nr:transporter substrate-binding domain-containing protein [Permianibacter aggregans]QGX38685.1 transporter substrate-binding domain-containing protein [Permianibacter aggregans]
MMLHRCCLVLLASVALTVVAAPAENATAPKALQPVATEQLTIYFNHRPPYYHRNARGEWIGVRYNQLKAILELAGLQYRWQELSVNRILHQLTLSDGNHCSGGWFKTPEREAFAQFSLPFGPNEPATAIVRQEFFNGNSAMLSQLLISPDTRVLTKQGQYYGDYLEEAMKLYNVQRIEVTDEQQAIVHQIALKRGDLMFLNRAEAHYLLEQNPLLNERLNAVDLQDKAPIPDLHFMCNKAMPKALMDKLNDGIQRFREGQPNLAMPVN